MAPATLIHSSCRDKAFLEQTKQIGSLGVLDLEGFIDLESFQVPVIRPWPIPR